MTDLLQRHVYTAVYPAKYKEWRDKFVAPHDDILQGLEALSDVQLQKALHEAIPGLTAERLNPSAPDYDGSFHLVTGMIMGIMHKRGLNIPNRIWPMA